MKRRTFVVVLASVAFVIAVYMALYQLHRITAIWDPLGGSQTARVLDSAVSRAVRNLTGIPDSALGAIAYAGEIVLAVEDRRRRLSGQASRLSSILYGLWSASLALAGIALVGMQIFVVHAICFLCCCTATLSVAIFAIAASEVIPAATRRDRGR